MPLLDKSKLEIKLGDYGTAPATALTDGTLLGRVQAYRRVAGGRMQPMDRKDIATLGSDNYHVSRKIDGEFTVLVYEEGEALSINPGGTVRAGLPLLAEAAALLKKAGVKNALIAGELWVARPDGKRPRVHDVSKIARRPESVVEVESLRFAPFDIIEIDGQEVQQPYADVWKRLDGFFKDATHVSPVETTTLKDSTGIAKQFDQWVEKEGDEGLVVRGDSTGVFKIKPRHTLDVAVVGFAEGTEDRTGMLHDLLIAVMRPEGTFHLLGRVGGGFTEEQRRSMLSDLKDMAVESDYAEVNADRVAYQMVRPEWVIEVSCLDLVSQTTRGAAMERMVLEWNSKESKFRSVRRLPLVSIISPQFIRLRDDKSANPQDIRLQQVTDLVEVPMADRDAREMKLPASEIIRRQAATKVLKGATMVRKLVLWKTNKEAQSDEFPAYVLHLTDFSPNRKNPLEREIRVSNSFDQMELLWAKMAEENFVKGWMMA